MPVSVSISLLLHLLVVVIMTLGLPFLRRDRPELIMSMPVEVVSADALANMAAVTTPELEEPLAFDRPTEEPPPPEPVSAPTPPTPPPPDVQPPDLPETAALPEAREPEPMPTAELVPEPPPPEPEPVTEPEPEPEPTAEPEPEEPPPETQQLAALAEVPLPGRRPAPPPRPQPAAAEEEPATSAQERPEERQTAALPAAPTRLGSSDEAAVREAIRYCWNVDVYAADVPAVEVRVAMRPNATVEEASIVDVARYNADAAFRAAADRALRAVVNPACQPFPLPAGEYRAWRSILFVFDPRDML